MILVLTSALNGLQIVDKGDGLTGLGRCCVDYNQIGTWIGSESGANRLRRPHRLTKAERRRIDPVSPYHNPHAALNNLHGPHEVSLSMRSSSASSGNLRV